MVCKNHEGSAHLVSADKRIVELPEVMAEVLERSYATQTINALANHPELRPFVGGDPKLPLDMTAAIDNDLNVFLMGEHGGFILIWSAPGVYEVHTLIRPEGRGKWALDAAREGIATMKRDYGAKHIWTRVDPEQRNVRAFTMTVGMKPCGQEVFDLGTGPRVYNLYEIKD